MESGGLILKYQYYISTILQAIWNAKALWTTVEGQYRNFTEKQHGASKSLTWKVNVMWWYCELHELNLTRPRYSCDIKLKTESDVMVVTKIVACQVEWKCCLYFSTLNVASFFKILKKLWDLSITWSQAKLKPIITVTAIYRDNRIVVNFSYTAKGAELLTFDEHCSLKSSVNQTC